MTILFWKDKKVQTWWNDAFTCLEIGYEELGNPSYDRLEILKGGSRDKKTNGGEPHRWVSNCVSETGKGNPIWNSLEPPFVGPFGNPGVLPAPSLEPPPSVPFCPVITFVITKVWQLTWLLVLLVCCFFRLDVTPNGLTTCESPFALSWTWMFSRENLIALMKPNKWQTRSLTM